MLLTSLVSIAAADCGFGGYGAWPNAGELPPRGEIVLVGRDQDRDTVRALTGLALVSGERWVPLERVALLEGSFDTTQIVLRPRAPLAPDRSWTLTIGDRVAGSWLVVPPPAAPPAWRSTPQVVGAERHFLGCGPAVAVRVAVDVTGAAWIEATVWPVDGGDRAAARLAIEDGHVRLGHGMCAGEFALEAGREYFADLVAVDAEGRRARADDSPIRFRAP